MVRTSSATFPTVSVVIPTYNRADRILETVRSAVDQTYAPLEVIVVDDASSDETAAVVGRFGEKVNDVQIRYERHATNLGGGAARNTGVRLAKGDLIAFLDSDDLWRAEKLEKQVERWIALEAPTKTVIYCSLKTINGWREEIRLGIPDGDAQPLADAMFIGNRSIQTSCMVIPRSLALSVPIDASLRAHQDFYLVLALERSGAKFSYVDEPLVLYDTAPSQSRISGGRRPDASLDFLEKYGHWLSPRAALGFKARYLALRLGQSGRRIQASSVLTRALLAGVIGPRSYIWYLTRALVPTNFETSIRRRLAERRVTKGSQHNR